MRWEGVWLWQGRAGEKGLEPSEPPSSLLTSKCRGLPRTDAWTPDAEPRALALSITCWLLPSAGSHLRTFASTVSSGSFKGRLLSFQSELRSLQLREGSLNPQSSHGQLVPEVTLNFFTLLVVTL